MKPITNKIAAVYQNVFHGLLAVCWLSGVVFFVLNTWFDLEGEFGPEKHFLLNPSLLVHAATAFFIMTLFGAYTFGHLPRTKNLAHSQKSGWLLLSALGYLILSAYILYYIGNETIRLYTMYSHLAVGFLLPLMLVLHLYSHKQHKLKLKKK